MKTIKVRFAAKYAESIGIFLYSLELKIIISWSEESILDDTTIYCILKLNKEDSSIPASLQIEKIRERNTIKIM